MRTALVVAAGLAVMVVGSGTAFGATTRADYVAQVDPICQSAQLQEGIAAAPVEQLVRREKRHRGSRSLKRRINRAVGNYFNQYIAIERGVNTQIAAVLPPPDDVSLIQVWLRARNELLDLESGTTAPPSGKNGSLKQALDGFFRLIGLSFETGDLVRDWGFQFCTSATQELQFIG